MLCHNFLIGKGHTFARRVFWEDTRQPAERRSEYRATRTYPLAPALTPLLQQRGLPRELYKVMSQLSDWKRAHMCTENQVYVRWYVHILTW
jgi:hypothetical protein